MITFLSPIALLAGSLLAVPLIIHLFKPRRVRRTPFSSLRWLHLSRQKLSRRIRWHQVILFLLRAAFIALLVLAIAKPIFRWRGGGAFVERFVVLDVSRSMSYRAPGRSTPIEMGKNIAADFIRQSLPGDRATVLLTGSTTRMLGPLTANPAIHLPALATVQAAAPKTDLGSALQIIRPILEHRREGAEVEIDFITDRHQGSCSQGQISSFVKDLNIPLKARVVDVGIPAAQNAWIADARMISITKPVARRMIRVHIGCVGDAEQSRTLRVSGLSGLAEMTRAIKLESTKLTQADLELPGALDARGQVAQISIEPNDALPEDDTFFLNLDPRDATGALIVEGDSTRIESMRPGFYLRAALSALSADGRAIEVASKTSAGVDASDFENADVVLLADVPQLSDANLAALESRVKSGGGLAIFLGPDIEPTFYNTKLYRPQLPSESLLAVPLKIVASAPPQHLDALTNIKWSHPLLAPLFDPVLGDLSGTLIRSYYEFDGAPQNGDILATIDSRVPAILDRAVGSGRVILFNTTANDVWSDLPRRKSFVPLIDRLLNYLSGGGAAGQFEIGDAVALPLPGIRADAVVTVTTPSGKKLTPTVQALAARTSMRLDPVQEAGIYRVDVSGDPAASQTFVVQAGCDDSDLTPIDNATLKKWWEPIDFEILSPESAISSATLDRDRFALSPWLIAFACGALLAEMFLVHWLCPRMNPSIVASVVPRRGMFSVTRDQQHEVGV